MFVQQDASVREGEGENRAVNDPKRPEQSLEMNPSGASGSVDEQSNQESQPSGKFQYLPDDYSNPVIQPSANPAVDEVNGIFEKFVLIPRKRVDSCLREFQSSVDQPPRAPMSACFDSWMKKAFKQYELDAMSEQKGDAKAHPFRVVLDKYSKEVESIAVNKHKDQLLPEVYQINGKMNELLDACSGFLGRKDEASQQILQIQPCSMKTKETLGELEHEIDKLASEVVALQKDIKAALPYATPKNVTGSRVPVGQQRQNIQLSQIAES